MKSPAHGGARPRRAGIAILAAAGIVAIASLSCSGGAPEIVLVNYQINLAPVEGRSAPIEQLSLFALTKEPDGAKDFDVMYLINDQAELMWTLSGESLEVREDSGSFWIGNENITMADLSPLPRGRYRLVLSDRAGNSVSSEVPIGAPPTKAMGIPSITISGELLSASSPYPRTVLVFKDKAGAVVRIVDAPAKPAPLGELSGLPDWEKGLDTVRAYGFDPKTNIGAFSWPTPIAP